ncbi:periplasmic sensor signal transduction histidine kinase [Rhodoferax ferrireducens T118]|uniref:histidine kinase n=1 Tax=Albidiferax ferrireducens (strain ATCC BAA-621 / DSM 15236 / T118) TaxID=338969 RepID=Q221P7_ALBFT|nr:ATP-binding protein [Rhodoferax ferrireducens]ABD68256.1 periplasmic sensor signal transduction histidine kinase [Rhodoferax ferrireducens T118]
MRTARRLKSLQARLLAPLLGLLTVVWLGAAVMIWFDASHELDELLDGHLAQAAALLIMQQAHAHEADSVEDAPSLHKYAPKVVFQVFHEGRLVLSSANAGTAPIAGNAQGFSTVRLADDAQWRVFATRGAEHDVQVYVGEQTESRDSILLAVLQGVLLPLVIALPLLALVGWWAVRQGLAPLRHLSRVLAQRRPQAMEPLLVPDLSTEMVPVVQALNGLFERIEQMLVSERRFTADAAHELRTPIAAIRAQAQVALGAGHDAAQRDHALQFTLAGCDRATHLVEQLLTLARLEAAPASAADAVARVDLSALARRVAADLAPTALARGQTLQLEAPTACQVAGDEALIGVLVRNLVDNALRYSPNQAQVWVSVAMESGQAVLRVQDSGAGMTEPEIARLGERFYRVLGSDQPGSGLGWSIVKRIATVFGAQVQVSRSERLGGLAVTVRWRR